MLEDSDDIIILQHTWSLASKAIQIEFAELAKTQVLLPLSFDAPYAAAIRIWCRLTEPQQQQLLAWFTDQMAKAESLEAAGDSEIPLPTIVPLLDLSGFVAASTIWKSRFHNYPAFMKWLNQTSIEEVRRRKPSRRRLEIYLPDWVRFWECRDRETPQTHSKPSGLAM